MEKEQKKEADGAKETTILPGGAPGIWPGSDKGGDGGKRVGNSSLLLKQEMN
jgi:hypothetical protein